MRTPRLSLKLAVAALLVAACGDGAESRHRRDASVSSTGEAATSCVPTRRAPPVFHARPILPWANSPEGQIITGNIAVHHHLGAPELYVAEPLLRQVVRLRGCAPDCTAQLLWDGLVAPVRAQPVDFDGDGDRDVLVADIGLLQARTDLVGRVVLLTDEGNERYHARVLLDQLGRVACAEPGDLDGDGDIDIAVCEFGAADGSLFWLERTRGGALTRRELRRGAGAIHAFPTDIDSDGDLDLVSAISQATQSVLLHRNDGHGNFTEETIFHASSEGFGLSGIELADLDADGDRDVVVSGGDYLDDTFAWSEQGLLWAENDGHGQFAMHRILASPGAYATHVIDVDGDCDLDIVVASLLVPTLLPASFVRASGLSWLENDGAQLFTAHEVPGAPQQLAAVSALRIDGRVAIFTGSFTVGLATRVDQRLLAFWSD